MFIPKCHSGGLDPTACNCNIVTFNLRNACLLCGSQPSISWSDWATQKGCSQNVTANRLPFDLTSTTVPDWAYNELSTGQTFDLSKALGKRNWEPVQIAVPIVVGVGVIVVAIVGFIFYRRRHTRKQSTPRRTPWENANLKPPRRFFGLLPATKTVRPKEVDGGWEIDDGTGGIEPPASPSPPPGSSTRTGTPSQLTQTHSRTTSESPLLPRANSHFNFKVPSKFQSSRGPSSATSSSSSSRLASLANKFGSLTSNQQPKYTTGVQKAPEFKRVHVVPKSPSQQFKIDEIDPGSPDRPTPLVALSKTVPKSVPLPSVLDIRGDEDEDGNIRPRDDAERGLLTERGIQALQARNLTQESVSEVVFAGPAQPPISDFSLGTSDLMTPSSTKIRGRPFPSPPVPALPPPRPDSALLPSTPSSSGFGGSEAQPRLIPLTTEVVRHHEQREASTPGVPLPRGPFGPRSDFTLATTDLMTPTTSRYGGKEPPRPLPFFPSRPDSVILPGSLAPTPQQSRVLQVRSPPPPSEDGWGHS